MTVLGGNRRRAHSVRLMAVSALAAPIVSLALLAPAPPASAAPPSNDDVADAAPLPLDTPTRFVPGRATSEPGEAAVSGCIHGAGPRAVWYTVTSDEPTTYDLTVGGGIRYQTQPLLGVFRGPADATSPKDLTLLDCTNPPLQSSQGELAFTARPHRTYYVQVGLTGSESLPGRHVGLNASIVDGPANDDFADRSTLEGPSGSVPVDNSVASPQHGDPAGGAGSSLWCSWTAPTSGDYQFITTQDGEFVDTFLGVYTGDRLGTLSEVATNDDVSPGRSGYGVESRVVFSAEGGQTYQVLADGAAKSADRFLGRGPFELSWGAPATTTTTALTAPTSARVGDTVTMRVDVATSSGDPVSGSVELRLIGGPRFGDVKELVDGTATFRVRLDAAGRQRYQATLFNQPDVAPSQDCATVRVRTAG